MADPTPYSSPEAITQGLTARAAALWGQAHADELRDSIATTSRLLHEIAREFPDGYVEPACYPTAIRNEEAP